MNKNLAIGLVVVVIIVVGAWAYNNSSNSTVVAPVATTTSAVTAANSAPVPQTFVTQKDGNYYVGNKLLDEGYVVDGSRIVYVSLMHMSTGTSYTKAPVNGADLATFSTIRTPTFSSDTDVMYGWGKDAQNIFYQGYKVNPETATTTKIDLATLTVIPNGYYRFVEDKNAVYEVMYSTSLNWYYMVLDGVDPATFVLIGDQCAKDKNGNYSIGYYGEFAKSDGPTPDPSECVHPGPGGMGE
ncbi:MAG TPA: DKNYY domain-containing protein [Candidatus Paceibacterota bacterium]|nr:DKNYY domain-containing protein [Candidatus Paceibacterota bacterium]